MTEDNKKEQNMRQENNEIKEGEKVDTSMEGLKDKSEEKTIEEKLKDTEEKLLRSLAEIENQRRRFEKEEKCSKKNINLSEKVS